MSNETKQQNVEQNRSDDLGSVKIQVKEVNLSAAQPSRAVRRTYPNRWYVRALGDALAKWPPSQQSTRIGRSDLTDNAQSHILSRARVSRRLARQPAVINDSNIDPVASE